MAPGKAAREDYEYVRGGVCNPFLLTEPLGGWRHVVVSERRIRIDFARHIKELVDVHCPEAEKIVLVMDNLNTYTPASLYEAFLPVHFGQMLLRSLGDTLHAQAWQLAEHRRDGTERALRAMPGSAPARPSHPSREVGAWEQERNARSSMIDWRISTENPRIKLKHLYPSFDDGRVTRPVPPFSGFSLHHEALLLISARCRNA